MSMGEYGDQFFIKYGADPRRIFRVPYTPNYSQFEVADEQEKKAFFQRFQLDGQRRRIIYSGRLVSVKRVDLLIDAFAAIAGRRPVWDLMIVGDGIDAQKLRDRVPVELRNRVIWTGFLERAELIAAYHAANVLVLPSDLEPWALVVQEAMAAGLPVVASDVVGAAHELVDDRKNGRIFPAGDYHSLVNTLMDTTCVEVLERYCGEVTQSLNKWRKKVDPVSNIRQALVSVGVLSENRMM
jgi:glycosyltransferase involved in cell wall biosynthesis